MAGGVVAVSGAQARAALEAVKRSRAVGRYRRYWDKLVPADDRQYFLRWVFAFASVQTGWRHNVVIYQALARVRGRWTEPKIDRTLRAVGAGMFTVRTRGLAAFHRDFWADPGWWRPQPGEGFRAARDRMVPALHGLGPAKTSFALELAYPGECDAVCVDRHMFRLYGQSPERASAQLYRDVEDHWREACLALRLPSPLARHVWWDRAQTPPQRDTRYWSHVFEAA